MTTPRRVPTAHITTGPFFPSQFIRAADRDLTRGGHASGATVALSGRVTDADGSPCVNAILELWQADAQGRFAADPVFCGWGRTWTDAAGHYRFLTAKPGPIGPQARHRPRPPYINVMIHASGLMRPLVTQMFFPGEMLNEEDPQLALVPRERRALLVAQAWRDADAPAGALALRFDIALAGPRETPFLED